MLASAGVRVEDVSHVFLTHLHPDHCDAFHCLPGAVLVADREGFDGARLPPRTAQARPGGALADKRHDSQARHPIRNFTEGLRRSSGAPCTRTAAALSLAGGGEAGRPRGRAGLGSPGAVSAGALCGRAPAVSTAGIPAGSAAQVRYATERSLQCKS